MWNDLIDPSILEASPKNEENARISKIESFHYILTTTYMIKMGGGWEVHTIGWTSHDIIYDDKKSQLIKQLKWMPKIKQ